MKRISSHSKLLTLETRGWVHGCSLKTAFNFSVCLKLFIVKCWEKKIRPNNIFQQQVKFKRKSQVEQSHYKHSNNFEKIKDDHI